MSCLRCACVNPADKLRCTHTHTHIYIYSTFISTSTLLVFDTKLGPCRAHRNPRSPHFSSRASGTFSGKSQPTCTARSETEGESPKHGDASWMAATSEKDFRQETAFCRSLSEKTLKSLTMIDLFCFQSRVLCVLELGIQPHFV